MVRKSIKGSKDSDSSLGSNKNMSHKIPSSGWGPGPGNLKLIPQTKKAWNFFRLRCHPQKTWKPRHPIFFSM